MNTSLFLSRIGLDDLGACHTLDFLGKVQSHCVTKIPYENLDILENKPVSLDINDIFDKIVINHRGGYCFELNALLSHMLREMGFVVRDHFARFLRGESDVPFRRHRIITVLLDGEWYMMDIGVGQIAPRLPLKLVCGEIQTLGSEKYRFRHDDALGWVLTELHKGEWRDYISFTEEKQYEADFIPASFWCEKHPDSPFNKVPMIAVKTEDGRKTVDGRVFKRFVGEELAEIKELDDQRLYECLSDEFGIRI